MNQVLRPCIVGLAVLTLASVGLAEGRVPVQPEAYPHSTIVYMTNEPNNMQIQCSPTSSDAADRLRIECSFAQASISAPPSGAQIERGIADRERDVRTLLADNPAKFWKEICNDIAKEPDRRPSIAAAWQDSCRTRNVETVLAAIADFERHVTARTCQIGFINTFHETLTRVNANTWQNVDGPRGACNITVVQTIWRSDKDSPWNFKQVKTSPENPTNTFCDDPQKVRVSEFTFRPRQDLWNYGCQYVRQ